MWSKVLPHIAGLNYRGRAQGSKQGSGVMCQQSKADTSQLSPHLQRQWNHAKNAHLGSLLVAPRTQRRVWWSCDQCPDGHAHEWVTAVNNRTNGAGCPFCAGSKVCQHNSLVTEAPAMAD